jgi:MFS family permease
VGVGGCGGEGAPAISVGTMSAPATPTSATHDGDLRLRGPLAGRYPAAAAMVMAALIPYLALSAAIGPITPIIAHGLHISLQEMSLASGMGNAAYAVGTVLAVQFAQLLHQRRMMVLYVAVLVVGSVLQATAHDPAMFITGHILQGLCTSLLLIAAVPPLALAFGLERLRETAVIMSMCIFGAVALGPLAGGLQASAHAWRPLFWVVVAISVAAFVLSLLTFEDTPPFDRSAPRAPGTIALATAGPVAAFWGASELLTHPFLEFQTCGLLALGLGLIIVLIVHQYRTPRALLTIRTMLTSTIPVAGIALALFAAAASVSATALTASLLTGRYSPVHIGLLYLPELGGAVATAVLLGLVISRRAMQLLPLAGMAFLAAGIAVFLIHVPSTQTTTLVGSGLTGIGLGATVAPALFCAGFSLPSNNLQRVFAIVELLRAVAAFMIAPVFAHLALTVGGSPRTGTTIALWTGLAMAIAGAAVPLAIYLLGGARPQTPQLERFLAQEAPAWYSPPLLATVRARASEMGVDEACLEID